MARFDRSPWHGRRAYGLILVPLLLVAASCTSHSVFKPMLTGPSGNDDACFGQSDYEALPAVAGSLTTPDGAEDAIGGRISLPKKVPEYATRFTSGLVASSIGNGRPALVIQWHSSSESLPAGTLIYADRAVCTLTPRAAEKTLSIAGGKVYSWTTSLRVKYGIEGVTLVNGIFVDVLLVWPNASAPSADGRGEYLVDWMSRIMS